MYEFSTTSVGSHGRIGEIALRARQFRTDRIFTQFEKILFTFSGYRIALVTVSIYLTIAQTYSLTRCCFLEVETKILPRIVHG